MNVVFVAVGLDDMAPGHTGIPEITLHPTPGPVLIHPPKALLRACTGRAPTSAGLTGDHILPTITPSIGITLVCRTHNILILIFLNCFDGEHSSWSFVPSRGQL